MITCPSLADSFVICKQFDGRIEAPSTIGEWTGCELGSLLEFNHVKGLTIKGAGVIDGKGSSWWSHKPQITNHTTVMKLVIIFFMVLLLHKK